MWNEPTKEQLAKDIPARLYSNEVIPMAEHVVHAHFFMGGSDWWITEYDPEQDLAFGFARINLDDMCSEWGYVSIAELRELKVSFVEVDYDAYWSPKLASSIEAIKIYA